MQRQSRQAYALLAHKRQFKKNEAAKAVVDAEALRDEWLKCKELGQVSEALGAMWQAAAESLLGSRHFAWAGAQLKDEMKSFAMLKLMKGWQKYDSKWPQGAWSYLSRCLWNAFLSVGAKEKKRESREKLGDGEVERALWKKTQN